MNECMKAWYECMNKIFEFTIRAFVDMKVKFVESGVLSK